MIYNIAKLDGELRAANVPIDGVAQLNDGSLRIDYRATATQTDITNAQQVVAAHDPTPTPLQRAELKNLPKLVMAALVLRTSTNWGTLTAAQKAKVQTIIDNAAGNILDLLN